MQFLAFQFGQGVQPVHGLDNLIAAAPQHKAHHLPEAGRIVDRHDVLHRSSRAPSNSRRRPQRSTAPMKGLRRVVEGQALGLILRSEHSSWRIQVSMSSKACGIHSKRRAVFQTFPELAARSCASRMVTAPSSVRICLPCRRWR